MEAAEYGKGIILLQLCPLSATQANNFRYLSISDNGKGLAEAEIKNLFTRYYRGTNTEEKPQGSGLGLAIAKQIVELHKGSIEVHSVLGKGTDIIIHLPKYAE